MWVVVVIVVGVIVTTINSVKGSCCLGPIMVTDAVDGNQVLLLVPGHLGLVVSQWSRVTVSTREELGAVGEHFAESNVLECHHIANSPEGLEFSWCCWAGGLFRRWWCCSGSVGVGIFGVVNGGDGCTCEGHLWQRQLRVCRGFKRRKEEVRIALSELRGRGLFPFRMSFALHGENSPCHKTSFSSSDDCREAEEEVDHRNDDGQLSRLKRCL